MLVGLKNGSVRIEACIDRIEASYDRVVARHGKIEVATNIVSVETKANTSRIEMGDNPGNMVAGLCRMEDTYGGKFSS